MTEIKKTILIVDDDEKIANSLSTYLSLKGYYVEIAETGKEAISKSHNSFFNLAILDVRLPDMAGTELLTRLQSSEPEMIKIMLTGYPGFENSVESLNKGADAYLVKPVELEVLLEVVEEKLKEQDDTLRMDQKNIVEYIESRSREIAHRDRLP